MLIWPAHDRRGTAALEFALIAPPLILLMIGVFDISKAVILHQQVVNAAHTIPLSASSLAVQSDKTTSLTASQAQQTMSAIFAEIPWLRSGAENGARSVTLSSITFVQTDPKCDPGNTTCSYSANVAWSVAYANPSGYASTSTGFAANPRKCGTLTQVAPTQEVANLTALTQLRTLGISNPDPILVVDVYYVYTPIFFNFITGPVTFFASGYWAVRSVDPTVAPSAQYTKYDIANQNGGAGKCAGFS